MRIVKLSKEVYGFDNINGCLAYFKHVLPWQKYVFYIVGDSTCKLLLNIQSMM